MCSFSTKSKDSFAFLHIDAVIFLFRFVWMDKQRQCRRWVKLFVCMCEVYIGNLNSVYQRWLSLSMRFFHLIFFFLFIFFFCCLFTSFFRVFVDFGALIWFCCCKCSFFRGFDRQVARISVVIRRLWKWGENMKCASIWYIHWFQRNRFRSRSQFLLLLCGFVSDLNYYDYDVHAMWKKILRTQVKQKK